MATAENSPKLLIPELSMSAALARKQNGNGKKHHSPLLLSGYRPAKRFETPNLTLLASMARREEYGLFLLTPKIA